MCFQNFRFDAEHVLGQQQHLVDQLGMLIFNWTLFLGIKKDTKKQVSGSFGKLFSKFRDVSVFYSLIRLCSLSPYV